MTDPTLQGQQPRPDLLRAVHADQEAKRQAAFEAAAPERAAREAQAANDAALFGTPGWSLLSDMRRARAAQHSARQERSGGDAA